MANESTSKSSIGFLGLLQLAFIILKLCKVISWSWVWIFTPLYVTVLAYVFIFLIIYWAYKNETLGC